MSIASRIESMTTHLQNDYDALESVVGTITEDKNIENIAPILDNLWEELPHTTGTGTSLSLATKAGKMKVNLLGNTSQYTTTGKNLLETKIETQTKDGVTITYNEDGTYTLNGTATAGTFFQSSQYSKTLASGTYTLGSSVAMPNGLFYSLIQGNGTYVFYTRNGIDTATITLEEDTTYNLLKEYIWVANGTTFNNFKLKPQLEKSAVATDYEEYTGGIASPNPDYPQTITNVTGTNTIKINGKNLFDKDSVVSGFVNADGTVGGDTNAYRTSDFIPIQPNTAYYKTNTASPRTKYFDSNKQPLNTTAYQDISIGGSAGTFTTPNNAYYLRFSYPIASVDADSIQIEKGTSFTEYEAYKEQNYTINLGSIELCKIGDYKDRFFKNIPNTTDYNSDLEDNEWYLEKKIGKYTFTGNEKMSLQNNGKRIFIRSTGTDNNIPEPLHTPNINIKYGMYSNKLVEVTAGQTWGGTQGISYDYDSNVNLGNFDISINGISTLEAYRTAVAGIILYYILQTPTYTPITGTLKDELEAAWRANSYNGTTNISQVNNDLPFNLSVTALGSE